MDVLCFISYALSNVTLHTYLNIAFSCRNDASEETHHQEISKSTKATGTRGGRRFLPSGGETIGILSKTGARHQNRHQERFVQPPSFGDIEANIGTKTTFPRWEEIFKKIKWEELPEYTPHNDPDMRRLNDEVLLNV
jgi:hypothetical protein